MTSICVLQEELDVYCVIGTVNFSKFMYLFQKQQLGCLLEEEPQDKQFSELMAQEEDPVLAQFQRSMSLPRGFGKREQLGYQQQQVVPPLPPVRVPSPRSDSVTVLRNLMINRHRVRVSCLQ